MADDVADEFIPESSVNTAVASTFADSGDLERYRRARWNGASERQALSVGDNGRGAWGDNTTRRDDPIVALPRDTPGLAHNRKVEVTGQDGRSVVARVADKMPATANLQGRASIDLNPGAAEALGQTGGVKPVSWRYIDGPGGAPAIKDEFIPEVPADEFVPEATAAPETSKAVAETVPVPPPVPADKLPFANESEAVAAADTLQAKTPKIGEQPANVLPPEVFGSWVGDAVEKMFPENETAKTISGFIKGIAQGQSDMTEKTSLPLLALGPTEKVASKLVATAFLGQQILGTPDQVKAFEAAKTNSEKAKIAGQMVIGYGAPTLGFMGHGEPSKATETPEAVPATATPETPLAQPEAAPAMPVGAPAAVPDEFIPETKRGDPNATATSTAEPVAQAGPDNAAAAGQIESTARTEGGDSTSIGGEAVSSPDIPAPIEPNAISDELAPVQPKSADVVPRTRAAAHEAASSLESKDPMIGQKTVQSVLKTNRALDDVEQALVMREFEKSRSEYDAAIDSVNTSADKSPEQAVAMGRLQDAQTRFQNATDAAYKSGTATARGLAFRAGTDEFSMARMLRELQAANGGRTLTPDLIDQTREMSGKLRAVTDRISADAELSQRMDAILKDYATKRASYAEKSPSRTATKVFLEDAANKAFERIKQRRSEGRLYAGIDPEALYDHAVIGAHYLAKGVTTFGQWSGKMLAEVGEHIRPFLKDIYDKSKQLLESTLSTDKKLAAYKKRLGTRHEQLQAKIDAGDFTTVPRQKLALDKEASAMRREYDSLRNQWKKQLNLQQKAALPGWRRGLDAITEYLRAEKLTGVGTLGKIASAGVQRPIASALEDLAGRVATAIPPIREIARGAPTENPTLSSFRRYAGGIARGIKETPSVLKGEHEPPEYSSRGPNVLQYPGRVHGAIKNPIKAGEYELGLDRARKWAENEHLDASDPEVFAQMHEFAKQRGLRAIWMNDNAASKIFRNALASMERGGDAGFVASRLGRILLPIVRVPTNVAIEAGRYHFGISNASVRIAKGLTQGIENMSPAEKDLVMSNLKKGAVGAGMFALGYLNHKQIGGFYNQATYKSKEQETGLRPMEARLFGVNIPSWVSHSPLMLTLNAGATFHDMMEKKHGVIGSEMAVLAGILENVPFVNEASQLDDILRGGESKSRKAIGGFFRSQVFPVIVQEIARWTDEHDANGHPIKRSPKTISQEVQLGAPGLRQNVPAKSGAASGVDYRQMPVQ